jgi:biopolymer transport protein ExbB
MKTTLPTALAILLAASASVHAQSEPENEGPSFERGAATVQTQLEESIVELNELREQIAAEKIPLNRQLGDLEAELVQVRLEYQQVTRLLDTRTLDLSNLRSEIKARQEEATYLSNLLGEYIRNFESRLHIVEIQRYEGVLETAELAPDNSNLSEQEIYTAQLAVVSASLDRLHDALGGTRFEGTAVDPSGLVEEGTFVLVGPAALFRSADGDDIGTAEQRLGSLEPAEIDFANPEDALAAATLISSSEGFFPLDPTLGNAHKIEATQETILEHIRKGGVVMIPIFALAGAALLVALYKWITLALVRRPSQKRIKALLKAVAGRDRDAAAREAQAIGGPTGRMLVTGVEHLDEPHELIEEIMYETVLTTRLKLQRFLPFIAVAAASAPLLGLLGTVTGIITTFKLITVFGSGDVKTLSGGISEALITTEFGLIVAIPSLLLHAFLSRKARGAIDQMEKAAVAFVNQVSKSEAGRVRSAAIAVDPVAVPAAQHQAAEPVAAVVDAAADGAQARIKETVDEADASKSQMAHQVKEFVDLLVPMVREKIDGEAPQEPLASVPADDEDERTREHEVGAGSTGGTA